MPAWASRWDTPRRCLSWICGSESGSSLGLGPCRGPYRDPYHDPLGRCPGHDLYHDLLGRCLGRGLVGGRTVAWRFPDPLRLGSCVLQTVAHRCILVVVTVVAVATIPFVSIYASFGGQHRERILNTVARRAFVVCSPAAAAGSGTPLDRVLVYALSGHHNYHPSPRCHNHRAVEASACFRS